MIRTLILSLLLAAVAALPAAPSAAAPIGTTSVLVQTGDAPPAGPGTFTSFLNAPALNDAGQVAFFGFLGGAGVTLANNEGLYRFGNAGAVQIARKGDAPPAGPGNFLSLGSPNLNDAGQAVFVADLGGAGVTSANNVGFYRFGDAGTVQIARTGDAAPAGPGNFTSLNAPTLNNAGQVAFSAGLSGTGVTPANNEGLFRFGDAGSVQIARTGGAAPAGPGNFLGL
ncbi:MAG: hypothetical protein KDA44_23190, partial [Planctomycetales bacterium]|nr:hypothetical protein [Planctomycetales bacterium]